MGSPGGAVVGDDEVLDAAGLVDDQVVEAAQEPGVDAVLGGVRRRALLDDRDAVRLHHRDAVTALGIGDAHAAANAIAHGVEQEPVELVELRPQAFEVLGSRVRARRVTVNEHHVLSTDGLPTPGLPATPSRSEAIDERGYQTGLTDGAC